jgi:hypothetical protein
MSNESKESVEYMFDESILEQSIRNEVSSAEQGSNNSNNNGGDTDNNNSVNPFNYDLDAAIYNELSGLKSKTDNNDLDENIKELHQDAVSNNNDDTKTSEVNTTSNNNSNSIEDNDPYQLALDVIREENLLYIPDDFEGELDADAIDYFKRQTEAIRANQIIQSQRNKFQNDPYKLRLFDYFFTAGADADIPTFTQINDGLEYWDSFDTKDEENQKLIISEYLKDGLNENNPSYEILLADIDKKVDDIISSYEGEDKANEAKNYFIEKHKEYMAEELQRVEEQNTLRMQYEQSLEHQRMDWNKKFAESINSKSWSPSKKQNIVNEQYQEVMYNGQYMPVWYVKESIIKNNPELYITYLDWLNNNFDLETESFIKSSNSESEEKTQVTRKILDLINKKQGKAKSHQMNYNRESEEEEDIKVNPLDNI